MTKTETIRVKWLDGNPPPLPCGITFGVPWPKDSLAPGETLTLHAGPGAEIPIQSRILGYWPDGSVKWIAVSGVFDRDCGSELFLEKGIPAAPPCPLHCEERDDVLLVDTGVMQCEVGRAGAAVLRGISVAGDVICSGAALTCKLERRTERGGDLLKEVLNFDGFITGAGVEHAGPMLAVVKIEGIHRHPGGEKLLPFILRLYFYAGLPSLRLVHTFIFDGDAQRDFLAGLGVRFAAPLRDAPHNRRAWFGHAPNAVWMEPIQLAPPMYPRPRMPEPNPERAAQLKGQFLENPGGVGAMPLWNRFLLLQDNPDAFVIRKGCAPGFAMIEAGRGGRSLGTAALSDSRGGLAVSLRDFWQAYPSALSIENAGGETEPAELTAWLWPPEAEPADLRHYTDKMYGPMYECHNCLQWEAGPAWPKHSNPYGIARTSELTLWALPGGVTREAISARAEAGAQPPLLVCEPGHYRRAGVFGVWSLPGAKNATARKLERRLDTLLDYYLEEIERRRWYGFWNYGDVMHSYDPDRHAWRYDEGGFAWDNTECGTDLWLWYSFLRTGRADVYRLAEAMTRHTSEVDIHHRGEFAGLGSRHNVVHWGCLCKEPRISMAGNRRFHYFLTGDERTGDVLAEVCELQPKGKGTTYVGPTWGSYCWNWVTAWERTGDVRYRDKLRRGMDGVLASRPPFIAGALFTLDAETGEMVIQEKQIYSYHMTIAFGGPEIWMELATLFEDQDWAAALAGYGNLWALPLAEQRKLVPIEMAAVIATHAQHELKVFSARMIAYAAAWKKDADLARCAWDILLKEEIHFTEQPDPATGRTVRDFLQQERTVGFTNLAAQWSLNTLECLELIGEYLP